MSLILALLSPAISLRNMAVERFDHCVTRLCGEVAHGRAEIEIGNRLEEFDAAEAGRIEGIALIHD